MGYEAEYERKEKREPNKPYYESECGEIKIKAENVCININCKEEKDKKDGYTGYKAEYEKDEKKETCKPHYEDSECGEVKIYAKDVYININCKEKDIKNY